MAEAHNITQYHYINRFECTGGACEDTCCKGWGMQVDKPRIELYKEKAPELLDAVTSGEAEHIMRRDPETDYCVKFGEDGWCTIHKKYGTDFLGNACHFYPRITRHLAGSTLMAGTLSCPEITRATLFDEDAFETTQTTLDRIPHGTKDYAEGSIDAESAHKVITSLVNMALDDNIAPERAVSRLLTIAISLDTVAPETWADGINVLINTADMRLQAPQTKPADAYLLVQCLAGLLHAAKKTARPRLDATMQQMFDALHITLDPATLDVMQDPKHLDAAQNLHEKPQNQLQPILRRWLAAQFTMMSYPFAGLGETMLERTQLLAVRFATTKLALLAHMDEAGNLPDDATTIRVIQSLSRFLDHLADPELSFRLYEQAGWLTESRLRGLVGDVA